MAGDWAAAAIIAVGTIVAFYAARWFRRASLAAHGTRPWWKKTRWVAAAVLLATAGYLASMAPLAFACGRGWVSHQTFVRVSPVDLNPPTGGEPWPAAAYMRFLLRCCDWGARPRVLRHLERRWENETDPREKADLRRLIELNR